MASNFAQYTNGVVMPTGISEAGANVGRFAQQGLSSFGQSLGEGLQAYNENVAKDQVLQEEAKQLGTQIQQFAAQFGDSPEHAPFAKSLQPYIEQLAKVPSMSLTQKMGAVTGVKAAFSNIGQQLQVFELMRGERIKRDMNAARMGVKEYDDTTVPTSIIASGKMPYFYNKTYAENESELVRLANESKARGNDVDLPTVLSNWRSGLKADAMSRTDLSPDVKERLVKQIDAGEGLTDNIQTEDGVTDYSKEAQMYESAGTSVKDQLAPPKVETPADKGTAPEKKQVSVEEAQAAGKKAMILEKDIYAMFGTRKNLEPYEQKKKDKMLAEIKSLRETASSAGGTFAEASAATELNKINLVRNKIQTIADNSEIKYLKELQRELDEGGYIGLFDRLSQHAIGDNRLSWETEAGIYADPLSKTVPQKTIVKELSAVNERRSELDSFVSRLRSIQDLGTFENGSDILPEQKLAVQKLLKDRIDSLSKPRKEPEKVSSENIRQMAGNLIVDNKTTKEQTKEEQPFALTNKYNMTVGTTTAQVATSIESKRKDMMGFFQNKYGYVPASFEESFKSIYPEANFKTMETPYGAFMYDGKEWKQIQMKEQKAMSNKDLAENKAVTFGKTIGGGMTDANEFGELVPNSGVFVRGIYAGSPTEANKFRTQMLEASNAKRAVGRLIEINDMVGESMPWNAKVWGEAKALLPQIKAGLRTDIIGVGTVSNYEQELINDVVADPTKFWSLESSDRAKLTVIMDKISNKLIQEPANFGLEVKVAGKRNSEIERSIRMGNAGKSKLELDFEARGGKSGMYQGGSTGAKLDWGLSNKIPDALK